MDGFNLFAVAFKALSSVAFFIFTAFVMLETAALIAVILMLLSSWYFLNGAVSGARSEDTFPLKSAGIETVRNLRHAKTDLRYCKSDKVCETLTSLLISRPHL